MALVFLLAACSSEQSSPAPTFTPKPTNTPSLSPVPFTQYGETLTDATYCTADGLPLTMDVYFPETGGPWPALVYIHGGSWVRGDKSETALLARGMTFQGYLVFSINYRLYPTARYPAMIEDVKCAI